MKRLKSIESNNKELERLGLKALAKIPSDVSEPDQSSGSTGMLPTNCIEKYSYQLIPADLQKEQQAFKPGEEVSIPAGYI